MESKNPKFLIIINLKVGSGHVKKTWSIIGRELRRRDLAYECFCTKAIGHTQTSAKEIAHKRGCNIILALGGDGALHEAINGLLLAKQKTPTPVSYTPAGSGDDFAKSCGISNTPIKTLDQIIDCQNTQNICISHYIERTDGRGGFFINNLGIGLDARIVHKTNPSPAKKGLDKLDLGQFPYVMKGLSAFSIQNIFKLIARERHPKKAYVSIVNNVLYIGDRMRVSPEMSPLKNGPELSVVEEKNIPNLLKVLSLFIQGRVDKSLYVHRFKSDKLAVKTKNSQFIHLDGEEFAKAEVNLILDTQTYPFWQKHSQKDTLINMPPLHLYYYIKKTHYLKQITCSIQYEIREVWTLVLELSDLCP